MQNGWLSSVSDTASPVISSAMSMARYSFKNGPTCICGMDSRFVTTSCTCIVGLVSLVVPPPTTPAVTPTLFYQDWGGATSLRLPGMETLYGWKWTVVSVHIGSIISVHLNGSALVNATLNKVVVAINKCEHPKENCWFDYGYKLCCYEIVS